MRKLFASGFVAFCLTTLSTPQFAAAQEPMSETMMRPRTPVEPRETRSLGLIRDQAVVKAQLRTARIEGRKWQGQSASRPTFEFGPNSVAMFRGYDHGGGPRYGYWGHYGPITGPYVLP